jgi:hypothetical protein
MLALALLPPLGAAASAPGNARLIAGINVLPGADQPYSVRVNASLLPINAVFISLPAATAGVTTGSLPTPPAGWTVAKRDSGNAQQLLYRGGVIPPNGAVDFPFPANVAVPLNSDRSGTFVVQLSGDNGQTVQNATTPPTGGTLTTTVRILGVEAIQLVGPQGIVDGTGTANQDIQVATIVRNFAQQAVSVTPSLRSQQGSNSNPGESFGSPSPAAPTSIAGNGGAQRFVFPVKLGNATSSTGDRSINFVAGATASNASGSGTTLPFTVQVPPRLQDFSGLTPTLVRPDAPITFTLNANKRGTPSVRIDAGELTFAGTRATLDAGKNFAVGSDSGQFSLSGIVRGADGRYDVTVAFSGVDDNGAAFNLPATRIDQRIEIDGIAPVLNLDVDLPLDGDGRPQEAAKNGDTIRVTGDIDDSRATIGSIDLVSDTGDRVPVSFNRVGNRIVGSATAAFAATATTFRAVGDATDPAGNLGQGASTSEVLDNITPTLTFAELLRNEDIPIFQNSDEVPGVIEVMFEENNILKGGCNARQWTVDGSQIVSEVRYSNGSSCIPGEAGPRGNPDNFRLLVLTRPVPRDSEPNVTYTPVTGDRAKDGAGNFTIRSVVQAVSGVAPIAPDIREVFRNTAGETDCQQPAAGRCERAFFDQGEDAFYTRFAGNDTLVRFAGGGSAFTIRVLDAAGNVLVSQAIDSKTAEVRVPIGSTDGRVERKLQLVNARGIAGALTDLSMVLDRQRPFIENVTPLGGLRGDQTTVSFNERIVAGTNFVADWAVYETYDDGQRFYFSPNRVDGSGSSRSLTIQRQGQGRFGGAEYDFQVDFGGERYEDRAGNVLPDNLGQSTSL